jgi:prephenate dehydrogenase
MNTGTKLKADNICIIGTGLIGGSLALAIRQNGYTGSITGAGRSEKTLADARQLGVIDSYHTDMAAAVAAADIVFISVPLGAIRPVLAAIRPGLKKTAVITDAGSAKQSVIEDARQTLGEQYSQFVPGHPIAGTENSGVHAAFAELYHNRRVILTPEDATSATALAEVTALWQLAGAHVSSMSAAHHDMVLAATSHLPHLLAFGLVDCLHRLQDVDEIFQYAAGGFRDFTRIASSDPVMWRDICLSNKDSILDMIQRYQQELNAISEALMQSDGEKLKQVFERAKQARDEFSDK